LKDPGRYLARTAEIEASKEKSFDLLELIDGRLVERELQATPLQPRPPYKFSFKSLQAPPGSSAKNPGHRPLPERVDWLTLEPWAPQMADRRPADLARKAAGRTRVRSACFSSIGYSVWLRIIGLQVRALSGANCRLQSIYTEFFAFEIIGFLAAYCPNFALIPQKNEICRQLQITKSNAAALRESRQFLNRFLVSPFADPQNEKAEPFLLGLLADHWPSLCL
jgi:hypothetical protein